MAGMGPERPRIHIDQALSEQGLVDDLLGFLNRIPVERLEWWDCISAEEYRADLALVQLEFTRGLHYRTMPVTMGMLREFDPRIARSLERRARMWWKDDERAIRGELALGEPTPLIYGWNA